MKDSLGEKEVVELAKLMRVYSGWDWGESDCMRIAEQMIKEGYRRTPQPTPAAVNWPQKRENASDDEIIAWNACHDALTNILKERGIL